MSDHDDIFAALDKQARSKKPKEKSLFEYFVDPSLAATSAALGFGTSAAQYVAPSRESQILAKNIIKEAEEAVRTGKVLPSGLTGVQKYAEGVQDVIPGKNINPILQTPSNVQQRLVKPIAEGTEKVLEKFPGAKIIPGSETGLIHEGTLNLSKSLENNPLVKSANVDVPNVTSGSKSANRLALMMESMNPQQRKVIENLLAKGYGSFDVFKKAIGKVATPLAVASVPEEISSAKEAYETGNYPRMISSGLGALGGTALGAGAALGAAALAPEIAGGLALAGGAASMAPIAHGIYNYFYPSKP